MKPMKKYNWCDSFLLHLAVYLLLHLAMASALTIFLVLSFRIFKVKLREIQAWASDEINSAWADIKENANAAIDSSIGQLGAPDPIASADQLKDSLKDDYSYPVAQEKAQKLSA